MNLRVDGIYEMLFTRLFLFQEIYMKSRMQNMHLA